MSLCALLALATAAQHHATEVDTAALNSALRFYRMRFRQNHDWGAVAWLTQAFAAWGQAAGDPESTAFAYEIVDWALQFQSLKTGAFLNDHQPDSPGATCRQGWVRPTGAIRDERTPPRFVHDDRDLPVLARRSGPGPLLSGATRFAPRPTPPPRG